MESAMVGPTDEFCQYVAGTKELACGWAGGGTVADAARSILRRYKDGGLPVSGHTAREAYRNGWDGLKDREMVGDALELLLDCHWLNAAEVKNPNGGAGTTFYMPSPLALKRLGLEGSSVSFGSRGVV